MGPYMVMLWGISLVLMPEAVRIRRRSPRHLQHLCVLAGATFSVFVAVWGIGLLIILPMGLGQALLGNLWTSAYPLVLPTTLYVMASVTMGGAGLGLHALGAAVTEPPGNDHHVGDLCHRLCDRCRGSGGARGSLRRRRRDGGGRTRVLVGVSDRNARAFGHRRRLHTASPTTREPICWTTQPRPLKRSCLERCVRPRPCQVQWAPVAGSSRGVARTSTSVRRR